MMRRRNEKWDDFTDEEWRSRPRKDKAGKRTEFVSARVTPNEFQAITERAYLTGMTLSDYIVCKALDLDNRLTKERAMQ